MKGKLYLTIREITHKTTYDQYTFYYKPVDYNNTISFDTKKSDPPTTPTLGVKLPDDAKPIEFDDIKSFGLRGVEKMITFLDSVYGKKN